MADTAVETVAWRAEPLIWGGGPRTFEAFLEPTCPYSKRAFPKLFELLDAAGEDRLKVKLRLLSQPWHLFSGVICRAIVAASTTEGGREAARRVMAAVYAERESFEFTAHCSGPNLDQTPNGILARIEDLSGVGVKEPFLIPDLDRETRWHTRYARQNGAHATPTFMIDGTIRAELSSGDPVAKWLEALALDDPAAVAR
ncbi:MAG TPA: DsbA family protein [Amaricoccus sp.]|nr:DsbA family protein [Amaricoccus sp.]